MCVCVVVWVWQTQTLQSAEAKATEQLQRVANLIEIESTLVSFALAWLEFASQLGLGLGFGRSPLAAGLGCRCMQLICATNEFICHLYAGNVGV